VTAWSKAVEEGKASKGVRHGEDSRRTFGSATFGSRLGREAESGSPKRGEPHGRLRGATNPQAVEGVDLRICPLRRKPLKPGGTAGTEHVRDVAVPNRSLGDGPGGCGRRTVVSAKGRSMNPMRGVRDVEVDLRVGWDGPDRANRYASEEELRRCLDPMRSR